MHLFKHAASKYYQSSILREIDLPTFTNRECARIIADAGKTSTHPFKNPSTQLCAGGELGKDTCYGDSGGPLFEKIDGKFVIYGIVASGLECARKWPSVYTRVAYFLKAESRSIDGGWIKNQMGSSEFSKLKLSSQDEQNDPPLISKSPSTTLNYSFCVILSIFLLHAQKF